MDFFEKKKKKAEENFGIGSGKDFMAMDLGRFSRDMQAMMDQLMKGFASNDDFFKSARAKPVRMGFSIKFNQGGRPVIREFGDVKRTAGKPIISGKREPLVDVNYGKKDVVITAEMPGAKKEDIIAKAGNGRVVIHVENKAFPYFKEIELAEKVRGSMKTKFNNGILEITLKKA